MTTTDPIPLSALNHWVYCPRRCGLIHQEAEFTDNIHTARGNAEHERVDRATHETMRNGARVEYALPVWSDRLGLIGKCDVVEFWPDETIYPIEYKHGPKSSGFLEQVRGKMQESSYVALRCVSRASLAQLSGRGLGRAGVSQAQFSYACEEIDIPMGVLIINGLNIGGMHARYL